MSSLLESYRILGVKVGAGMTDVTTSYRQLCREYHPDISDNPGAEEQMKQINIAYTVLREKFRREAKFREHQTYSRPIRRYPAPETWQTQTQADKKRQAADVEQQAAQAYRKRAAENAAVSAEAEAEARSVLHSYFQALNTFDYTNAYSYLSPYDKRHITLESFIQWRESVAKLYPMREFKIAGKSSVAVITWGGGETFHARKFHIIITEGDCNDNATQSGDIDKLVINENGQWGVFLGYKEVSELTRTFERRFETRKRRDIAKRWEEYTAGFNPEYNMLNIDGMRKSVLREFYRQRRYGGTVTFAAIAIKRNCTGNAGQGNTGQGNTAQGNAARGYAAQGFTAQGNTAHSNTAYGNATNSNTAHSNTAQGNTAQSNTAHSNTAQGNTAHSNTTQGNAGQGELLRSAAKTICAALRETDVPAYAGDGVFVVMFVELGRKNAEKIISRLAETIRKNAGPQLGRSAEINYEYQSWTAGNYADMDAISGILKKVGKKL